MTESVTITDNRTGRERRDPHRTWWDRCQDVQQADARRLVLRSGVRCHRHHVQRDHRPRRRQRNTALPGVPDRTVGRALDLPRGVLPASVRRASHVRAARQLGARRHLPHVHPREHAQAFHGGLPPRCPPDGHAGQRHGGTEHLLPRSQGHPRSSHPLQADQPPHLEGPDPGGDGLSGQRRYAVRVPRQQPQLRRELPLDDVASGRAALRAEPDPRPGARRAVHPARRPRAELLDHHDAGRRFESR